MAGILTDHDFVLSWLTVA